MARVGATGACIARAGVITQPPSSGTASGSAAMAMAMAMVIAAAAVAAAAVAATTMRMTMRVACESMFIRWYSQVFRHNPHSRVLSRGWFAVQA